MLRFPLHVAFIFCLGYKKTYYITAEISKHQFLFLYDVMAILVCSTFHLTLDYAIYIQIFIVANVTLAGEEGRGD